MKKRKIKEEIKEMGFTKTGYRDLGGNFRQRVEQGGLEGLLLFMY